MASNKSTSPTALVKACTLVQPRLGKGVHVFKQGRKQIARNNCYNRHKIVRIGI